MARSSPSKVRRAELLREAKSAHRTAARNFLERAQPDTAAALESATRAVLEISGVDKEYPPVHKLESVARSISWVRDEILATQRAARAKRGG